MGAGTIANRAKANQAKANHERVASQNQGKDAGTRQNENREEGIIGAEEEIIGAEEGKYDQ